MADTAESRKEAAALFARAQELQSQRDYEGARACYEKSLRLYEDKKVMAAYLKLMATIGPL